MLCGRRALAQPLPSASQLANKQKGAHFLSDDLVLAHVCPPQTCGFTLQFLDLPHIWSGNDSDVIEPEDILALAAAVYMFIKLYLSPEERHPHTFPTVAKQQLNDVSVLHNACTIQQSRTSNSGCWNTWAVSWKPSRQWFYRISRRIRSSGCRGTHSEFTLCMFAVRRTLHLRSTSGQHWCSHVCFRPCAVSFLCALLILHNSHSSQLPFVDILKAISTIRLETGYPAQFTPRTLRLRDLTCSTLVSEMRW